MVPLWLPVLLDDLVNQLPNLGRQTDVAPGLLMGMVLRSREPQQRAHGWVEHRAIPPAGPGIVPFGGSCRWTVTM